MKNDWMYSRWTWMGGLTVFWLIVALMISIGMRSCSGEECLASWYGAKGEVLNEYTAGGRRFNADEMGGASWFYNFGTKLRVRNIRNGKECIITIWDRGPAWRLVRQGRKLDLYRSAFLAIAELREGVIRVDVEEVELGRSSSSGAGKQVPHALPVR